MNKSLFCIITTIQAPTEAVIRLMPYLNNLESKLVVVGDKKGPAAYPLENAIFLSLQDQLESQFELARKMPTDHYARKNIGYLTAITQGASCIYETDDDNALLPNWTKRHEKVEAKAIEGRGQKAEDRRPQYHLPELRGKQRSRDSSQRAEIRQQKWVNVYKYFTDENIWPRGFPLDEINSALSPQVPRSTLKVQSSPLRAPIQQGLVNNSPDVDAIWRLILDRPIDFQQGPSVYLPPQCWCPFNSQSTWWWPIAYPLLYLPSYCSFRMTDIWRSFIAQRCLWELGNGIVFHSPEVIQERNVHNLMNDFKDEIPGYTRNQEFVAILEELKLDKGYNSIQKNLLRCYDELVKAEFFLKREIKLVETWIEDLERTSC